MFLDSNLTEISDLHFYFDLDNDGTDEEINMLYSDSSYLAIDLNEDGKTTHLQKSGILAYIFMSQPVIWGVSNM
ncbi:MAG: hypothetical protein HUJ71_02735 [Pseudobutyrivibrio sp.]|nr:hypothetical protein [Pseudobutyrivibrio sp.]